MSVLLALCNVAAFAMMLLAAAIWGPEQLFGEYDRAAGRQAVISLVLILVAIAAWSFFFASYRRAGGANVLGFVVMGAAAALDVIMLVHKMRSLGSARPDAGLADSDALPWWFYTPPAAWAALAALCVVALRRPGVRWVALPPIALVGCAGFVMLGERLAGGGAAAPEWMLVLASPLLAAFLLIDAVFPDRTRTGFGTPPR